MLELKMYFLEKFLRYDKCRNNYGATLVTIENEEEMNYVRIVLNSVKDMRLSQGKSWMGKFGDIFNVGDNT